jgi:uncharacterized protein YgiM (DUF1202 family)
MLPFLLLAIVLAGCGAAPIVETSISEASPEAVASPSPSPVVAIATTSTPAPTPSPTGNDTPTAIVVATATTATATSVPTTPPPPPTPEPERLRVVAQGNQGANMRHDPGTNNPVVKSLRDGAEVTIVGPDQESGGQIWRNVQEEDDTGWVVSTALRSFATPTITPTITPTSAVPPTSTPAPTSATTPTSVPPATTTAPEAEPERVDVSGTSNQGANLRADPGLTGRLLRNVPEGTRLTIVGDDQDADGRTWRHVRDDAGTEGWLVADAVTTVSAPGATATQRATPSPGTPATPAATGTPPAATPTTGTAASTPAPATTLTPVAIPSPPDTGNDHAADAEPTPEPERVEVFDSGSQGANLRRDPGTHGFVMQTVPDGSLWTIVGPDQDVDGKTWRNVQDEQGTTGWLAGEVVRPIVTPTPTPRPGAPGIGAPVVDEDVADDLSDAERAATPCRPNQIKGDASTGLYYPPDHPDYPGLKLRVRCFDSQNQARASGYDAAPDATPTP